LGLPLTLREAVPKEGKEYYLHASQLIRTGLNNFSPKNLQSKLLSWKEDFRDQIKKDQRHLIQIDSKWLEAYRNEISESRMNRDMGFLTMNDVDIKSYQKHFQIDQDGSYQMIGQFSAKRHFRKGKENFYKIFYSPVLKESFFVFKKENTEKLQIEAVECSFESVFKKEFWRIRAFFDDFGDEYIQIRYLAPAMRESDIAKNPKQIDLKEFPILGLTYRVQDPSVQTVQIAFRIRTEEKRVRDFLLIPPTSYPYPAASTKQTFIVDLLDKAQEAFPGSKHYYLASLEILPHKLWGIDCSKEKKGEYEFDLYGLNFLRPNAVQIEQFHPSFHNYAYLDSEQFRMTNNLQDIPKNTNESFRVKRASSLNLEQTNRFALLLKNFNGDNAEIILGLKRKNKTGMRFIKTVLPLVSLNEERKFVEVNLEQALKDKIINKKGYELKWIEVKEKGKRSLWRYYLEAYKFELYQRKPKEEKTDKGIKFFLLDGNPIDIKGKNIKKTGVGEFSFKLKDIEMKRGEHILEFIPHQRFKWNWLVVMPQRIAKVESLPIIDYEKKSPTYYHIFVENAQGPFWLSFNDLFHPNWKAYIRKSEIRNPKSEVREPESALWSFWRDRGKRTEIPYHVKINGFANGWWVDPEEWGGEKKGDNEYENFEIVIEFTLQKWFEMGWLISGLTLLGSLAFLGIRFLIKPKV
jgi:hypothetical protein